MYTYLYYLNREIDSTVMDRLVLFMTGVDLNSNLYILKENPLFKEFLLSSFKVKREYRPSVSQLADFFKSGGCNLPGSLAYEYVKGLESMARTLNHVNFIV